MAKTREQKKQAVKEITEKLSKSKVVILTSFATEGEKGVNVSEMRRLKKDLKNAEAEYFVSKKTLVNISLNKANYSELVNARDLSGSLGLVFGYGDAVSVSKAAYDFSKTNGSLKLLAALVDNEFLNAEKLVHLAKLPPREVMLGYVAGMAKYPITGLVSVLQANLKNLVLILSNIKK